MSSGIKRYVMSGFMFFLILNIVTINISAEDIAEDVDEEEMHLAVIDMMNAFLILVSCIFIFAIVNTLRNKKLLDLVRSAHFFRINDVISAWTLLGSAFLLFTITELIYSFDIIEHDKAQRLLRTFFGILFATGLFLQYKILLRYIKQAGEKRIKGDKK